MILLIAKTGLRFSEALALTPADFNFSRQSISVSKTWDYKGEGGFLPTKNQSSIRKVQIDWQTVIQFSQLIKDLPADQPIFVKGKDMRGLPFSFCVWSKTLSTRSSRLLMRPWRRGICTMMLSWVRLSTNGSGMPSVTSWPS